MCPKGLSARTSSTAEVVTAKTAEAQVATASGSATAKTASASVDRVVGLRVSGVLRRPLPTVDPPIPWMLKRHMHGIYDCVERHNMLWVNRLGMN